MLRHRKLQIISALALLLLFAVTACSAFDSPAATATPVPTVDREEIVRAVLAELEPRLAQATVTPAPTVDADGIVEAVMEEVEAQLIQPTATPGPVLDMNDITAEVMAAVGPQIEDTLISLYQRANPAVVFIVVPFVGSGSGFIFSPDGYIVTNSHVVADQTEFEVIFWNGDRQPAELVGTDVDSDLAVIKVEALPNGVEPLPLADPDETRVGQFVVAIGNPFGEQGSMSLGIISGLGRSLRSQREAGFGSTYSLPQVIQTDAPINPGNSGGPLLNLTGEVVGVNAAIRTLTGTNSGVGFSIPVAAVRQIAPSLISDGSYAYPYMGVGFEGDISLAEQEAFELPQTKGAYIISVTAGGPADEAGLIPADPETGKGGDLIVKIDEQEINDFSDLNSYLVFNTKVGQTIEITVVRDGEPIVVPLTLDARPQ
jgi:S1-C subfamily serine protease